MFLWTDDEWRFSPLGSFIFYSTYLFANFIIITSSPLLNINHFYAYMHLYKSSFIKFLDFSFLFSFNPFVYIFHLTKLI
jgi:hypothetical protein